MHSSTDLCSTSMYICACGGVQSCVSEHVKLSSCLLLWTQTPHLCFRNESCWHEAVSAELVLSLFLLNCYQLTKTKPRTQETGKSTHPVHPVVTQLQLSLLLCSKTNCLMHVLEMIRRFTFKAHLGLQPHSSWALNLKVIYFFFSFCLQDPSEKIFRVTCNLPQITSSLHTFMVSLLCEVILCNAFLCCHS